LAKLSRLLAHPASVKFETLICDEPKGA